MVFLGLDQPQSLRSHSPHCSLSSEGWVKLNQSLWHQSDAADKQKAGMLVTLWSNRIRDVDTTPGEWVTAFNTLQIEWIDLLSQSYDGAILNLGMKPEFLPINSLFSSLDHAVSKFLFFYDNQFKWGNSCQTQCSNYIVRKDW